MRKNPDSYEIRFTNHTISKLSDIRFLDFDRTWLQGRSDFRVSLEYLPGENVIHPELDKQDVVYNYNNEGFRCDDFTTDTSKNTILYAGCSQTEGMGGNIDEAWSYIMHKELYPELPFLSVARAGYGWQKIIANIIVYIEKYGRPKIIYALLPNVMRYWKYSLEDYTWNYVQDIPTIERSEDEKDAYKKAIVDFFAGWGVFEKYLESINVKLLWSTWARMDAKHYQTYYEDNGSFFYMHQDELEHFVLENSSGAKSDLVKRDGHDGPVVNKFWSKKFIEQAESRGML